MKSERGLITFLDELPENFFIMGTVLFVFLKINTMNDSYLCDCSFIQKKLNYKIMNNSTNE